MIKFDTIYERAIALFDDPVIKRAYQFDKVLWAKMMYPHLLNGLSQFTNPVALTFPLADQTAPNGQMETFTSGTGGTQVGTYRTVNLHMFPATGSITSFKINGVPDTNAAYNMYANTVTFSKDIPNGTITSAEFYTSGQFNVDYEDIATNKVPQSLLRSKVVDILSRALVVQWAENEQNFLLDIKNVLTDTDFKVYSPANSLKSKKEWVERLKSDLATDQTKLGWDLQAASRHGGKIHVI